MSRAGSLAGGSTCFVAVDFSIFTIVDIPLFSTPCLSVGKFGNRIFHFAVHGAEFLTELGSADRADFYALAAGNALCGIDMGTVSGT